MDKIINLVSDTRNGEEIIRKLGVVKKQVSNTYIITPLQEDYSGISIVLSDNIVLSTNVNLKTPLELKDVFKKVPNHITRYNHYDEETYVNFNYNDSITLCCIFKGYFEDEELLKMSFTEFKIIIK
jgi:hypothetical protein